MKKKVPRKILFVCTGNIFRSMSAEYCLKNYLKDCGINDAIVNSAGTIAQRMKLDSRVLEKLKSLGIDASKHKQKKLTKKDLLSHDIVIAMAQNHIDFIKKKFNFEEAVLFNEIAIGEKKSVDDVCEIIKNWQEKEEESKEFMVNTVKYLNENTPKLYKNLDNYLLFLDFIAGRRDHGNGLPFIILHETKNAIAFMSKDIPKKEDGHILVIPKKRYINLDNIPKKEQHELMSLVSAVGKALRKTHKGYNILLNNGNVAGQTILHSHFHIIPRNHEDDIQIEVWKNKKMTSKEFLDLNEKIRNEIINFC